MMNPFLARFQDHASLVAPENRAWFESCIQAIPAAMADIEQHASASADDDYWGEREDNAWLRRYRPYVVSDGVLQIPVKGVLLHDFPYALGGWATGYDYIWRAFERGMGDFNVKGIALVVDSPGGMVAGCFEMTDKMYALRGTKPVAGFASESAYSAAYATISVADTITVTRTGGVGSIGVVTMHIDVSKAYADAGYKITFIHAGKHKVDGNAFEPLADDVKARIQARIDDLYSIFVSTVARNRNLDEQAVRDTEALTYGAPDAVSIGLADKIGAFDDALADFSASLNLDEGDETMAEITQAQFDAAVQAARTEGETAGKTAGMTEGATAERTRISAILGSDEAANRGTLASHLAFKTNMSVDDAKGMLAVAAEESKAAAPAADGGTEAGAGIGKNRFDASMDKTGNPNLGAPSAANEGDPKPSRAQAALALRGIKPKADKAA